MKRFLSFFLSGLLSLTALLPAFLPSVFAAESTQTKADLFLREEWEVLTIVNQRRLEAGLEPLTGFSTLQEAGDIRAREITEVYSHTRPNGESPFTVLDGLDVSCTMAAENIAYGQTSAEAVMEAWMNSPGHRANILTPEFSHVGIGMQTQKGRKYWVQMFTDGGRYTSFEVRSGKTHAFRVGTAVEDMGLYAVLETKGGETCYLPILSEYCSGLDVNTPGKYELAVSVLGYTDTVFVRIYDKADQVSAGTCGEYVTWSFDQTGQLTLSGSGAMENYRSGRDLPWSKYADAIETVEVEEGITSLSSNLLCGCSSVECISIPGSVNSIGKDAFKGCDSLVIYGPRDSFAEAYASEQGIPFAVLEEETAVTYSVTFSYLVAPDQSACETVLVEEGGAAVPPVLPELEGYTFIGWNQAFDCVTSDLSVSAGYQVDLYPVLFLGRDGETLKRELVAHGRGATAPEVPEAEGYTFIGWDRAFDCVTSDLTVKALYEEILPGTDPAPDSGLAPEPDPAPDSGSTSKPDPEPDPAPDSGSASKPDPEPDPAPDSGSASKPDPEPDPAPEPGGDPAILWGDANGDGSVNMKDVVLLRQYLANFDFTSGTSSVEVRSGADANGDGATNMKDVVLLRQYLANFDFAAGTSSVLLGPKE